MSALKEFANFILLNVASLAATYDRFLSENGGNYAALPADSRLAMARRLIKTVAAACEAETPDPLCHLFEERSNTPSLGSSPARLPHPLAEIECLGQTLTPVVINLEAGKFLWQMLAEARATTLKSISFNSIPVSNLVVQPELPPDNDNTANQAPETSSRQQWNLLPTVIDNLLDYIYAKDTESRFILLNTATAHLLGASSVDEVIGKTDLDFFPPEMARQFRADEQALMQSGQSLLNHEEQVVDSATGQTRWNLTSKIPLRDDKGKVVGLVGINRDITERKQAEEQFRKLSRAVEQSANTIVITDTGGHIEYVNPKFAETTGYTRDEAIGQHTRILKSGITSPEEYKRLWETIRAGGEWQGEFCNKKKNGELYWEFASISPIKDENGVITHFLAVKENITERKQTEEALRRAEANYGALIQNMPTGLYRNTPGPQGRFIMANPAIARIFGYDSVDEFMQVSVADLYIDPAKRQVFAAKLLTEGQVIREELQLKRKDGKPLWGAVTARVVNDERGEITYFDGMIEDITERKRLEHQVQESLDRLTRQIEAITIVAQQISGTLTLNELFHRVVDLMQTEFGYYHAQIYTMVEGDMVLQAGTGEVGRRLKEGDHRIPLSAEQSLVIRAVWEGAPVLVPDVFQEPTWLPNPLLPETKAELAVPITLGVEIFGVLDVQSNQLGGLNEEDQLLLLGLCGQIAIAIETRRTEDERSRLLAEVERRARREQTIREITERMRAANNLEQLVKITANELGQRLSAGHAIVELGLEPDTQSAAPAKTSSNNGY
jgi:PAS domain S-box-containing protein